MLYFVTKLLMMEKWIHWKALVIKTNMKRISMTHRRRYTLVCMAIARSSVAMYEFSSLEVRLDWLLFCCWSSCDVSGFMIGDFSSNLGKFQEETLTCVDFTNAVYFDGMSKHKTYFILIDRCQAYLHLQNSQKEKVSVFYLIHDLLYLDFWFPRKGKRLVSVLCERPQ